MSQGSLSRTATSFRTREQESGPARCARCVSTDYADPSRDGAQLFRFNRLIFRKPRHARVKRIAYKQLKTMNLPTQPTTAKTNSPECAATLPAHAFGPVIVGNDIVDLRDTEAVGKAQDLRFVQRVLCPLEYQEFQQQCCDTTLWLLWAAKEAAYKVICKLSNISPVARSLRVVGLSHRHAHHGGAQVRWRDLELPIRWNRSADYVHCVAWWPKPRERDLQTSIRSVVDSIDASHNSRAALSQHWPASASSVAVRSMARELFKALSDLPIEIIRRPGPRGLGPPRFCLNGRPLSGWDLSLSHHGRYLAAAVSHGQQSNRH